MVLKSTLRSQILWCPWHCWAKQLESALWCLQRCWVKAPPVVRLFDVLGTAEPKQHSEVRFCGVPDAAESNTWSQLYGVFSAAESKHHPVVILFDVLGTAELKQHSKSDSVMFIVLLIQENSHTLEANSVVSLTLVESKQHFGGRLRGDLDTAESKQHPRVRLHHIVDVGVRNHECTPNWALSLISMGQNVN